MEQIAAHLEAAYTGFTRTTEGTPEYYQALEELISLLFPDDGSPDSEDALESCPPFAVSVG